MNPLKTYQNDHKMICSMDTRPDQNAGRGGLRVASWGSTVRVVVTLTLPDPHAGQHTSSPNPDPAGTLGSAGRIWPSSPIYIKLDFCKCFFFSHKVQHQRTFTNKGRSNMMMFQHVL